MFFVCILAHLQNGDIFPSLAPSGIPVGAGRTPNPRRSGVMVKDGDALARATSIIQGRQRESLQMRLVAFLGTASRGGMAITIVYRLYGER
jgi:hypothetical protein